MTACCIYRDLQRVLTITEGLFSFHPRVLIYSRRIDFEFLECC